jgi:hypothetical protein
MVDERGGRKNRRRKRGGIIPVFRGVFLVSPFPVPILRKSLLFLYPIML